MRLCPFLKKVISGPLCLMMVLTQIYSQPASAAGFESALPNVSPLPALDPFKLKLPKSLGKIEEAFSDKGEQIVILIQDAHAIPDAQKNIQKLIAFFQEEYGIDQIAVEGVSSSLEPQIFKSFPERQKLKAVFKEYLQRGELTGASAAALFNPQPARFEGVENWGLYEKGYRAYLNAWAKRVEIKKLLTEWNESLNRRKTLAYSPQLLRLDQALNRFLEDHGDLTQTLQILAEVLPPESGSEIELVLAESRGRGDDAAVTAEVRWIAGKIRMAGQTSPSVRTDKPKEFEKKFQDFQTDQMNAQTYALYLKGYLEADADLRLRVNQLDPKIFDKLTGFSGTARRLEAIEGTRFFKDFLTYAKDVKASLAVNEEQRALDRESEQWALFNRFAELKLDQEDWQEVSQGPGMLKGTSPGAGGSSLWPLFKDHVAFYENAKERDAVMFGKLIEMFKRQAQRAERKRPVSGLERERNQNTKSSSVRGSGAHGAVLLIAGGFHTHGITQLLKEKGVSYAVIMPEIETIPEQTNYEEQMLGRVSWRRYLKVEKGTLDLNAAFIRGTRDRLLENSKNDAPRAEGHDPRLLKNWRDQIIRDLSEQGRIEQSGDFTRFIDEIVNLENQGPFRRQWIKNIKNFIGGMRDLDQRGQLNPSAVSKLLSQPSVLTVPVTANALARAELRHFGLDSKGFHAARSEVHFERSPNTLQDSAGRLRSEVRRPSAQRIDAWAHLVISPRVLELAQQILERVRSGKPISISTSDPAVIESVLGADGVYESDQNPQLKGYEDRPTRKIWQQALKQMQEDETYSTDDIGQATIKGTFGAGTNGMQGVIDYVRYVNLAKHLADEAAAKGYAPAEIKDAAALVQQNLSDENRLMTAILSRLRGEEFQKAALKTLKGYVQQAMFLITPEDETQYQAVRRVAYESFTRAREALIQALASSSAPEDQELLNYYFGHELSSVMNQLKIAELSAQQTDDGSQGLTQRSEVRASIGRDQFQTKTSEDDNGESERAENAGQVIAGALTRSEVRGLAVTRTGAVMSVEGPGMEELNRFLKELSGSNYALNRWGDEIKQVELAAEPGIAEVTGETLRISEASFQRHEDAVLAQRKIQQQLLVSNPQFQAVRQKLIRKALPELSSAEAESLAEGLEVLTSRFFDLRGFVSVEDSGTSVEVEKDEAAWKQLSEEVQTNSAALLPAALNGHAAVLARIFPKMNAVVFKRTSASVYFYFAFRQLSAEALQKNEDNAALSWAELEKTQAYRQRFTDFLEDLENNEAAFHEWSGLVGAVSLETTQERRGAVAKLMANSVFSALERLQPQDRTALNYQKLASLFVQEYLSLPLQVRNAYAETAAYFFEQFQGDAAPLKESLALIGQMVLFQYERQADLKSLEGFVKNFRHLKNSTLELSLNFLQVQALLLQNGLTLYHPLEDYKDAQTSGDYALRQFPAFTKGPEGNWVLSAANSKEVKALQDFTAWLEKTSGHAVTYRVDAGERTASLQVGNKQLEPAPIAAFPEETVRMKAGADFAQTSDRKQVHKPVYDKPQDAFAALGILAAARRISEEKDLRKKSGMQQQTAQSRSTRDLTELGALYDGRPSAEFFKQAESAIEARHAERLPFWKKDTLEEYDSVYVQELMELGKSLLEAGLPFEGERVLAKAFIYLQAKFYFETQERREDELIRRNSELLNQVLSMAKLLVIHGLEASGEEYFNFAAGFDPAFLLARYRPLSQTAVIDILRYFLKNYSEQGRPEDFESIKRISTAWERNLDQSAKSSGETLELLEVYRDILERISGQDAVFFQFLRDRADSLHLQLWQEQLIGLDQETYYYRQSKNAEVQERDFHLNLIRYLIATGKSVSSSQNTGAYQVAHIRQAEDAAIVTYRILLNSGEFVDQDLAIPQGKLELLTPVIFDEQKPADYLRFFWGIWRTDNALHTSQQTTAFHDEYLDESKASTDSRELAQVLVRMAGRGPSFMDKVFQSLENDLWPSYKKLEIINRIFDTAGEKLDPAAKKRLFELWHQTLTKVAEIQNRMDQFDGVMQEHDSQWDYLTPDLSAVYLQEIRKYSAARVRFGVNPQQEFSAALAELDQFDQSYSAYAAAARISENQSREIPVSTKVDDEVYQDEKKRSEGAVRLRDDMLARMPLAAHTLAAKEQKNEEGLALTILSPEIVKLEYLVSIASPLEGENFKPAAARLTVAARAVAEALPDQFTQKTYRTQKNNESEDNRDKHLLNHANHAYQVLEASVKLLINQGALEEAAEVLALLEKLREAFHQLAAELQKEKDEGRSIAAAENQWRIGRFNRLKLLYSRGQILLTLRLAQKQFALGLTESALTLARGLIRGLRANPADYTDPYKIYLAMELSRMPWLAQESAGWFQYLIQKMKLVHKDPQQQLRANDAIYNLTDAIDQAEGLSVQVKQKLLTELFERIRKELTPASASPSREEESQSLAMQAASLMRIYEVVHESPNYPELKTAILEHFAVKARGFHYEQDLSALQGDGVLEILNRLAQITAKAHPDLTQESAVSIISERFPENAAAQDDLNLFFPEATRDYMDLDAQTDAVQFLREYKGEAKQKAVLSFYSSLVLKGKTNDAFREAVMAHLKQDLEAKQVPDAAFQELLKAFIRLENEQTANQAHQAAQRTSTSSQNISRGKVTPALTDFSAHAPVTMLLLESFKTETASRTEAGEGGFLLEVLLAGKSHEEVSKGAVLYRELFLLSNLTGVEKEKIFFKILQAGNEFGRRTDLMEALYAREIRYDLWDGYTQAQREAMSPEAELNRNEFLDQMSRLLEIKQKFRAEVQESQKNQGRKERGLEAVNVLLVNALRRGGVLQLRALVAALPRALEAFQAVLTDQPVPEMGPENTPASETFNFLIFYSKQNLLESKTPQEQFFVREANLTEDLKELTAYLRRAPEPYLSDAKSPYHAVFVMRFLRLSPERRRNILDDFRNEKFSDMFSLEELMRRTVIQNGVGDIKFGQILSTRDDLITSEKYRLELAKLKDKVPAIPYDTPPVKKRGWNEASDGLEAEPVYSISQALRNSFGAEGTTVLQAETGSGLLAQGKWQDAGLENLTYQPGVVFYKFWKEPIAVASVGQAHRAVIWDGKQFVDVIVKIQKPNAAKEVREGREAWLDIARYAEANPLRFPGVTNPSRHVETIFEEIAKELNFNLEKQNFLEMAGVVDGIHVTVPKIYEDHSNETVLVMSRAKGVPIGKTPPALRPGAAALFIKTILGQVFTKGLFHGDPHDRNVFIDEDGNLTLLDLGMVGSLDESSKDRFFELIFRTQSQETDAILQALRAMGTFPADFDSSDLRRQVAAIISEEDKGIVSAEHFVRKLGASDIQQEGASLILFFGDESVSLKDLARLDEDGLVHFKPGLTEQEVSSFAFPETLKDKAKILADVFRESQKPLARQIQQIFETAGKSGLSIDSNYTIAIKTIITAEGVAHQLDSSFDITRELAPMILPYVWKHTAWTQRIGLLAAFSGSLAEDDSFLKNSIAQIWKSASQEEKGAILSAALGKTGLEDLLASEAGGGGPVRLSVTERQSAGRVLERVKAIFSDIFPQVWSGTSAQDRAALISQLLANPAFASSEMSSYVQLLWEHAAPEDLRVLYFDLLSNDATAERFLAWIEANPVDARSVKEQLFLILEGAGQKKETSQLQAQLVRTEVQELLLPLLYERIWPSLDSQEKIKLFRLALPLFSTPALIPVMKRMTAELFPTLNESEKVQMVSAAMAQSLRYPSLTLTLGGQFLRQASLTEKLRVPAKAVINLIFRSSPVNVPRSEVRSVRAPAVRAQTIVKVRPEGITDEVWNSIAKPPLRLDGSNPFKAAFVKGRADFTKAEKLYLAGRFLEKFKQALREKDQEGNEDPASGRFKMRQGLSNALLLPEVKDPKKTITAYLEVMDGFYSKDIRAFLEFYQEVTGEELQLSSRDLFNSDDVYRKAVDAVIKPIQDVVRAVVESWLKGDISGVVVVDPDVRRIGQTRQTVSVNVSRDLDAQRVKVLLYALLASGATWLIGNYSYTIMALIKAQVAALFLWGLHGIAAAGFIALIANYYFGGWVKNILSNVGNTLNFFSRWKKQTHLHEFRLFITEEMYPVYNSEGELVRNWALDLKAYRAEMKAVRTELTAAAGSDAAEIDAGLRMVEKLVLDAFGANSWYPLAGKNGRRMINRIAEIHRFLLNDAKTVAADGKTMEIKNPRLTAMAMFYSAVSELANSENVEAGFMKRWLPPVVLMNAKTAAMFQHYQRIYSQIDPLLNIHQFIREQAKLKAAPKRLLLTDLVTKEFQADLSLEDYLNADRRFFNNFTDFLQNNLKSKEGESLANRGAKDTMRRALSKSLYTTVARRARLSKLDEKLKGKYSWWTGLAQGLLRRLIQRADAKAARINAALEADPAFLAKEADEQHAVLLGALSINEDRVRDLIEKVRAGDASVSRDYITRTLHRQIQWKLFLDQLRQTKSDAELAEMGLTRTEVTRLLVKVHRGAYQLIRSYINLGLTQVSRGMTENERKDLELAAQNVIRLFKNQLLPAGKRQPILGQNIDTYGKDYAAVGLFLMNPARMGELIKQYQSKMKSQGDVEALKASGPLKPVDYDNLIQDKINELLDTKKHQEVQEASSRKRIQLLSGRAQSALESLVRVPEKIAGFSDGRRYRLLQSQANTALDTLNLNNGAMTPELLRDVLRLLSNHLSASSVSPEVAAKKSRGEKNQALKNFAQIRAELASVLEAAEKEIAELSLSKTPSRRSEVRVFGEDEKLTARLEKGLVQKLEGHYTTAEISAFRKAAELAEAAHEGQFRFSGKPYSKHLADAVESYLRNFGRPAIETLIVILFHDLREDQPDNYPGVLQRLTEDSGLSAESIRRIRRGVLSLSEPTSKDLEIHGFAGRDSFDVYLEWMLDPEKDLRAEKEGLGSALISDQELRDLQRVKLADILANLGDMTESFSNPEGLRSAVLSQDRFPLGYLEKIQLKVIPRLVQGASELTSADQTQFYEEAESILSRTMTKRQGELPRKVLEGLRSFYEFIQGINERDGGSILDEDNREPGSGDTMKITSGASVIMKSAQLEFQRILAMHQPLVTEMKARGFTDEQLMELLSASTSYVANFGFSDSQAAEQLNVMGVLLKSRLRARIQKIKAGQADDRTVRIATEGLGQVAQEVFEMMQTGIAPFASDLPSQIHQLLLEEGQDPALWEIKLLSVDLDPMALRQAGQHLFPLIQKNIQEKFRFSNVEFKVLKANFWDLETLAKGKADFFGEPGADLLLNRNASYLQVGAPGFLQVPTPEKMDQAAFYFRSALTVAGLLKTFVSEGTILSVEPVEFKGETYYDLKRPVFYLPGAQLVALQKANQDFTFPLRIQDRRLGLLVAGEPQPFSLETLSLGARQSTRPVLLAITPEEMRAHEKDALVRRSQAGTTAGSSRKGLKFSRAEVRKEAVRLEKEVVVVSKLGSPKKQRQVVWNTAQRLRPGASLLAASPMSADEEQLLIELFRQNPVRLETGLIGQIDALEADKFEKFRANLADSRKDIRQGYVVALQIPAGLDENLITELMRGYLRVLSGSVKELLTNGAKGALLESIRRQSVVPRPVQLDNAPTFLGTEGVVQTEVPLALLDAQTAQNAHKDFSPVLLDLLQSLSEEPSLMERLNEAGNAESLGELVATIQLLIADMEDDAALTTLTDPAQRAAELKQKLLKALSLSQESIGQLFRHDAKNHLLQINIQGVLKTIINEIAARAEVRKAA